MRLLLDECIDRRLMREFTGYNIKTVPQMGWTGIKNGQLLGLASQEFDIFITVDKNLPFEQNLPQFNRFFVTWHGSIGGHKWTKSLSGKRLN